MAAQRLRRRGSGLPVVPHAGGRDKAKVEAGEKNRSGMGFVPHPSRFVPPSLASQDFWSRAAGVRLAVHAAVFAGHTARFTTAADLLLDLNGQETARALDRRLRHYTRPALLAIDEIGYLAADARAADLLFQIVSRRYEHRAILITTNLPFKRWDTIFPNASCAVAVIDRLTHHAEILPIEGDSYRRRDAELSQKQRRAKTKRRSPVPIDT